MVNGGEQWNVGCSVGELHTGIPEHTTSLKICINALQTIHLDLNEHSKSSNKNYGDLASLKLQCSAGMQSAAGLSGPGD
jgi:hypothetical protein